MSRLTRDGTAENPSRETRFSGANGDREMFIFPVQLTTSRVGNLTRLIHTLLYVMTIHTYENTKRLAFDRPRAGYLSPRSLPLQAQYAEAVSQKHAPKHAAKKYTAVNMNLLKLTQTVGGIRLCVVLWTTCYNLLPRKSKYLYD